MQDKQHEDIQMEKALEIRLLKMLLYHKVINQPTYDRVVKIYVLKEAV